MSTRIVFAGILGGIVMFIWTSIAHMMLPLGEAGISEMPNQQALRDAMAANLTQPGLYHFPGHEPAPNATSQEKKEAMEKAMEEVKTGPSGLLMYNAARPFNFAKYLGIEFATEVVEAILAVFLLAQTSIAGFGGRVGFVLTTGILASIATNISYWNWYGFPAVYTGSYMLIQIVGFFCVGIVAALVLGKQGPQSVP